MIYIVTSVLIILILGAILFYLKKSKSPFLVKQENFMDYVSNVILMFVAVFLGIYFNNLDVKNKQIEQVIRILKTCKDDLDISIQDVDIKIRNLQKMPPRRRVEYVSENTYKEPTLLGIVLRDDLLISNLYPKSLNELLVFERDVTTVAPKFLIDKSIYFQGIHNYYLAIKDRLFHMKKLIDYEVSFQNGDLTEIEIEKRLNNFLSDLDSKKGRREFFLGMTINEYEKAFQATQDSFPKLSVDSISSRVLSFQN